MDMYGVRRQLRDLNLVVDQETADLAYNLIDLINDVIDDCPSNAVDDAIKVAREINHYKEKEND